MKGTVLNYDQATNTGWIRAEDGNRYSFTLSNYLGKYSLKQGLKVDFETNGNEAIEIYATDTNNIIENIIDKIFGESQFGKNINYTLTQGIHNQFGFIVSLLFAGYVYLFGLDMFDGILVMLLVFLSILFYGGVPKKLLKITLLISIVVILISMYQFYDAVISYINPYAILFGQESDQSIDYMLIVSNFIPYILFTLLVSYAGFQKKYTINKNFN